MSQRPAEIAEEQADGAASLPNQALQAHISKGNFETHDALMAGAIQHLSNAVREMATGLRATYILLEKIERQQSMRQQ